MGVYEEIKTSRRLVHVGIGVGYALALFVLVVRVVSTDTGGMGEYLGSIGLALSVAVAPTLAWISLDRRGALLPVAALASFLAGLVSLVLLPVSTLVGLLWLHAWSRRPIRRELPRKLWWAGVALAFAPVVAVLAMSSHLDPVCTETLADGSVVAVDPAENGYPTGWRLGSGRSITGSADSDGVVADLCASDTVVRWEGALSIGLSLALVEAGRRWPVNQPAVVST